MTQARRTPRDVVNARAVLRTLREAIGDDEFADIARELPRESLQSLAPA